MSRVTLFQRRPPGKFIFIVFLLTAFFFVVNNDQVLIFGRNVCQNEGEYESLRCFVDYYTDKTEKNGVKNALDDLKMRYALHLVPRCHQLAHVIGRAEEEHVGDIGEAFKYGDSICTSGYYHGVVESYAVRHKDALGKEQINEICSVFRHTNKIKLYDCSHGLGHGIMDVTHDNIFQALQYCDGISADYERVQCLGGVFMENTTADGKDHISRYFKEDDIFYPCTAVDEKYKEVCYWRQPRHILMEKDWDFSQSFAVCSMIENTPYRQACYQGLGREADDIDNPYRKDKVSICANAPSKEAQEGCVTGTVLAFFPESGKAKEYCEKFIPSLAKYCEDTSTNAFATLATSPH